VINSDGYGHEPGVPRDGEFLHFSSHRSGGTEIDRVRL
jgi:hypothetical protein